MIPQSALKKYLAEFIGTFTLVLIGCGTAMLVGCDAASGCGYLLTAFAFGLTIVGMAYCVGNISGCHINPAVSLAVFMNGGMSASDFGGYAISQCLGAFCGSLFLKLIFALGNVADQTGGGLGLGTNGLDGVDGNPVAGLLTEILLTFIFVMTILGVTSKKARHGSFGGVVIGFTLVLVHILGIGLTGTSVNPARSIGPALMAAFSGNTAPLAALWVFIVGPFLGAALAAVTYRYLEDGQPEAAPEKPFPPRPAPPRHEGRPFPTRPTTARPFPPRPGHPPFPGPDDFPPPPPEFDAPPPPEFEEPAPQEFEESAPLPEEAAEAVTEVIEEPAEIAEAAAETAAEIAEEAIAPAEPVQEKPVPKRTVPTNRDGRPVQRRPQQGPRTGRRPGPPGQRPRPAGRPPKRPPQAPPKTPES